MLVGDLGIMVQEIKMYIDVGVMEVPRVVMIISLVLASTMAACNLLCFCVEPNSSVWQLIWQKRRLRGCSKREEVYPL